MRVFKFALVAILLVMMISGALFSYVLFAPVTADNVRFRLASVCAMGTAALRLNEAAAAELAKLHKGSCGCLASRLIDETGSEAAARVTEAARKLGIIGMRRKWNKQSDDNDKGGGLLETSGLKDRIVQEFSERYVQAANACEAQAT